METHSRRNWLPGWQEGYVAIVRGFEDPDLLRADRESPTMSSVGKMAEGAQQSFSVCVGDVRSAFLRGDGIEMDRKSLQIHLLWRRLSWAYGTPKSSEL